MRSNHVASEEAVSPVVGVMLMLVVTIIIAAVVSAFAGGITSSSSKTPVTTFDVTFSQSRGMTISHDGGDTINSNRLSISFHPSSDFGEYEQKIYSVNKTIIKNTEGTPLKALPGSYTSIKSLMPGDTVFISREDCENYLQIRPTPDGDENEYTKTSYGIGYPENIGKRIIVKFADSSSGQIIATKEVKITA